MKSVLQFVLAVVFFLSCRNTVQDNRAMIVEHFALLNQHDLTKAAKQYNKRAEILTNSTGLIIGSGNLKDRYYLCFYFCDTQFNIQQIISNDSYIAVQYEVHGKRIKPYLSSGSTFYPNGIHLKACSIFKIKNHEIVSETEYDNEKYYSEYEEN